MSRRPKLTRVESPAPRARALGRLLTAALRHEPARLGLQPDAQGWVDVDVVLAALHAEAEWADVVVADLEAACHAGAKSRLEIVEGRMRARWGHSLPGALTLPAATPPERLYHGTAEASVALILGDGLRPMGRQFVHLSENLPAARAIGYRKSAANPALLEVDAGAMVLAGHVFHAAGDGVWLTVHAPAQFIRRVPGR